MHIQNFMKKHIYARIKLIPKLKSVFSTYLTLSSLVLTTFNKLFLALKKMLLCMNISVYEQKNLREKNG